MALAKARVGARRGEPFGACLVLDGKVVSCVRSGTARFVDATSHAEVLAIRRASRSLGMRFLDRATVYSSCEPCPMCFYACEMAGVSRIVFSALLEDLRHSEFSRRVFVTAGTMKRLCRSKIQLVPGVLRDEGKSVFALWSQEASGHGSSAALRVRGGT